MLDSVATKSEPMPRNGGGVDVTDLVLADLVERREAGTRKYGTALQTRNGRDALVDAYQEILDTALYLRQRIEEEQVVVCPHCKSTDVIFPSVGSGGLAKCGNCTVCWKLANPRFEVAFVSGADDARAPDREAAAPAERRDGRPAPLSGAEAIAAERSRQIAAEGYSAEHDDQHYRGELAMVAAMLVIRKQQFASEAFYQVWRLVPAWGAHLAKRHEGDRVNALTIAGAMIAAEIDRLNRADAKASVTHDKRPERIYAGWMLLSAGTDRWGASARDAQGRQQQLCFLCNHPKFSHVGNKCPMERAVYGVVGQS